jgi:hypothetical protein
MNLGNKFKELYEIELETVINDELKPKKEGISMGETIEMINKHSKAMQLWYRMWDNTKCSLVATPNLILPRVTLL